MWSAQHILAKEAALPPLIDIKSYLRPRLADYYVASILTRKFLEISPSSVCLSESQASQQCHSLTDAASPIHGHQSPDCFKESNADSHPTADHSLSLQALVGPDPSLRDFQLQPDLCLSTRGEFLPVVPSQTESEGAHSGVMAHKFTFQELAAATDMFSDKNCVGKGKYGQVFKGELSSGLLIAVKKMCVSDPSFFQEIEVMSSLRHDNIVPFLGFCVEDRLGFIVLEFVSGGTLWSRLGGSDLAFSWTSRLSAVADVARALRHLHSLPLRIFHSDITSRNVLLRDDGTALLADFGVSTEASFRMKSSEALRHHWPVGTPGYQDPAYVASGLMSEATEVFSFGILLLEVFSGLRPARRCRWRSSPVLTIQDTLIGDRNKIIASAANGAQWPAEVRGRVADIALLCTSADIRDRPTFAELTAMLEDVLFQRDTSQSL